MDSDSRDAKGGKEVREWKRKEGDYHLSPPPVQLAVVERYVLGGVKSGYTSHAKPALFVSRNTPVSEYILLSDWASRDICSHQSQM